MITCLIMTKTKNGWWGQIIFHEHNLVLDEFVFVSFIVNGVLDSRQPHTILNPVSFTIFKDQREVDPPSNSPKPAPDDENCLIQKIKQ